MALNPLIHPFIHSAILQRFIEHRLEIKDHDRYWEQNTNYDSPRLQEVCGLGGEVKQLVTTQSAKCPPRGAMSKLRCLEKESIQK